MNFIEIVKLLLKPELWEQRLKNSEFLKDEVTTKDGKVRFLANTCCYFREGDGIKVLYAPSAFTWFFIVRPLCAWTFWKVKKLSV